MFSLIVPFCPDLVPFHSTASEKGITFARVLIVSIMLVVVAVLEGLPLAVTLALAFATKQMTAKNLLVRILSSCETVADASPYRQDRNTLKTSERSRKLNWCPREVRL